MTLKRRWVYGELTAAEARRRVRICQCCGHTYKTAIHAHLCPMLREWARDLNNLVREIRAVERMQRPLATSTIRRKKPRRAA